MTEQEIDDLINIQIEETEPQPGFYDPSTHEVWTGSEWVDEREWNSFMEAAHELNTGTTNDIDKLLEERGKQYGSFKENVFAISNIMNTLRALQDPRPDAYISPEDVENFFLVLKLVRLQRATDEDSIADLQGYAKLIKERRFGK